MNAPANLKYTKSDEWFDPQSGKAGLSDYAQSQLSDIVFVELLVEEGDTVEAGKAIASVESVKASAEIYSPAAEGDRREQGFIRQARDPQQRPLRRGLDDPARGRLCC
jgi:multidrug efflux pump subunit AcrA (membrane-fusion protein)